MVLVILFLIFFVRGAGGHGRNPFEFVYFLALPLAFLWDLLPSAWSPFDGWGLSALWVATGLIQWTLIGYVIDRPVWRWRAKRRA
jgi:hypothetical protein